MSFGPHCPNLNSKIKNINQSQNQKENISSIISSINLSSEDFKDAFYVPKRHKSSYNNNNNNLYSNEGLDINNNHYQENETNKFNEIINQTNSLHKSHKLNLFLNNNNNNYLLYNRLSLQNLEHIQPFTSYD